MDILCEPNGVYPCGSGGPNDYVYVFTSYANPEHWERLLRLMGREDHSGDKRYNTNERRLERRAEVDELVATRTQQHDRHEAMRILGEAKILDGAMMDTMKIANDESFRQRGIRQTIQHPIVGPYTMCGWPVRFGGSTLPVKSAPVLGEQTSDFLANWLKLDPEEPAILKSEGAVA